GRPVGGRLRPGHSDRRRAGRGRPRGGREPVVSVDAPARAAVPVAELRGAGRTFDGPSPVIALRPTDLNIYAGDWIAVTGRSGSGKPPLLHLLGLLGRPTTGTYLLDGVDTAAMSDRERTRLRARHIGFV